MDTIKGLGYQAYVFSLKLWNVTYESIEHKKEAGTTWVILINLIALVTKEICNVQKFVYLLIFQIVAMILFKVCSGSLF